MISEECFLLDTFIDNNMLKLRFIGENEKRFCLYFEFFPKIQVKASEDFIKRFPFDISLVIKKDIFLQKDIKVWELQIPLQKWDLWKRKFLFNENIEVFNTDLSPVIQFYFEYSLFPTGKVRIKYKNNRLLYITPIESPFATDYKLPFFRVFSIRPVCENSPRFSKWEGIEAGFDDNLYHFEEINRDFIEFFFDSIKKYNPDLLITMGGDKILLPEINRVSKKLGIKPSIKFIFKKGGSFVSYGKTVYRDSIAYIYDKIHIDMLNSFFVKHSGLHGLIEVARLTSFPLQDAARISPGSSISLMELRTAFKNNCLIPSTKAYPERFKTATELMEVDKGGLYFFPPVGSFENVAELDFFSMYPSIISRFNISVDTFKCNCCKDSNEKNEIPFTRYYFCGKKKGIIPATIEPLIEKRKRYKKILKDKHFEDIHLRQSAIKWMLVTCFGYLGYKNAKFGCVEAHEATTAYGRFILLKAKEIAENLGFSLIYAVTDSLYVYKQGATEEEYKNLAKTISIETRFTINFEGIFKFIKFLPASRNNTRSVMNKFFGIYTNGNIKIRGLMCKRRDTPVFIKNFQKNLFHALNSGEKLEEIFNLYIEELKDYRVSFNELAIKKRITKSPENYKKNTLNAIIAKQIGNIHPGESILYIVTDEQNPVPEYRAMQLQFADSYDVNYYKKLLIKSYEEVI